MERWSFYSNGKYIYVLSDDDYLSKNYVENDEKFEKDKKCFSAGPLPVSVNEKSKENPGSEKINQRSRYTDGKELAINFT